MTNLEKYNQVFKTAFGVADEQLSELKYQDIPAWDSVGHMGLISELEDAFDIQFETDDIIDLNSYKKGIEILEKYDVVIE